MSWPVLPHGFLGSQAATGDQDTYQIQRSLRFNSADSAYLSRTYGSGTSATTWTISCWVKRSSFGAATCIFSERLSSNANVVTQLDFQSSDTLRLVGTDTSGSVTLDLITTQVFRDPSAWFHLVVAADSTQATASERFKIYINGSQVTSLGTATYPAQNSTFGVFSASEHNIGRRFLAVSGTDALFNGYITEFHAIDGQALTPSSFGETDPITGRWKAKAYTGDYGANGFYLNFSDNSGTTATTLGKDSAPISGTHTAANNWTPNNFSASSGVGNDSLTDSPANYGTISTTLVNDTYQINRSLRFNSADGAYLSRTPASAGNRKTWTWSGWVKRGSLSGTRQGVFIVTNSGGTTYSGIEINSDSIMYADNTAGNLITTSVYRDVSSWYHIVVALDTTQATSSNRTKIYVNGSQVTSFSSTAYPSQNSDSQINSASQHSIGSWQPHAGLYFDGYLTEINFIDGQALTPDSFGVRDANTYLWKPKAYTGTYGTNGFYLNFSDNSGTTATTLGKDQAGSNNWTPNNFSVASGVGNDSLVDTPTYYGTDSGVGGEVRGNYCTLNPINTIGANTFSNGNLDVTIANGGTNLASGTIAISSGKWYWEVIPTSGTDRMIGISDASVSASNASWQTANGWAYYSDGSKYNNNSGSSYGASYATNDVIGVALNMDSGEITFYKNNLSQGIAFNSGISGKTITPMLGNGATSASQGYTANFGQRPFAHAAPSGFRALRDYNKIPVPTGGVVRGNYATLNPIGSQGSGVSISNGNLDITVNGNSASLSTITIDANSTNGFYAECTINSVTANGPIIGIRRDDTFGLVQQYIGFGPNDYSIYVGSGAKFNNGSSSSYGSAMSSGDVLGIAVKNGKIYFRNASGWFNSGNPVAETGSAFSGISGYYFIGFSNSSIASTVGGSWNFGQRPWAYDAPFGFLPLCTTLLPTPTIQKPSKYMDVVTWTGNGNSSRSITGFGFSPDLIWMKGRSGTPDHALIDTVRGTGARVLSSNQTSAENDFGLTVTSFDSGGFTVGSGSLNFSYANINSATYVAWAWDEAPIARMDIVAASLSGTSPVTVNHSLGVAPKMIIGKIRSNTSNWYVNHSGLANNVNYYVMLNSTSAQASSSNIWDGAPTSTSFVVGNPQNGWNGGTVGSANYVFYLFAEVEGFSKFGSYTGNGSSDGPFVYCGFRPRWVMVKRTDVAGEHWQIQDSVRSVSNPAQNNLFPNLSQAEQIGGADRDFDFVSNGFKLRGNNTGTNASGGTYIFCAFAESAFKYSRAR